MSIGESLPYRSPISKLLRFFCSSRDKWKAKCKEAKRENKSLKYRLAVMTEKPESLEGRSTQPSQEHAGRNAAGRGEAVKKPSRTPQPRTPRSARATWRCCGAADLEVRIPRQQFPLAVIGGSLALVLRTGTRLQRVAERAGDALELVRPRRFGGQLLCRAAVAVAAGPVPIEPPESPGGRLDVDHGSHHAVGRAQVPDRGGHPPIGLECPAARAEPRGRGVDRPGAGDRVERRGGVPAVEGGCRQDRRSAGDRQRRRKRSACRGGEVSHRAPGDGLAVRHQAQDGLPLEARPGPRRLVVAVRGEGASLQAAGVAWPSGCSGASPATEQGALHESGRAGGLGPRVLAGLGSSQGAAEGGAPRAASRGETGVVAEVRHAAAALGSNAGGGRRGGTLRASRGHPRPGGRRTRRVVAEVGDSGGPAASQAVAGVHRDARASRLGKGNGCWVPAKSWSRSSASSSMWPEKAAATA